MDSSADLALAPTPVLNQPSVGLTGGGPGAYVALPQAVDELRQTLDDLRAERQQLIADLGSSRAESRRFRALFEESPAAQLVTDGFGCIESVNLRCTHLLAESPEQLEGASLFALFGDDDAAALHNCLSELGLHRPVDTCTVCLRGTDPPRSVELTAAPALGPDGQRLVHWVLTASRETTAASVSGDAPRTAQRDYLHQAPDAIGIVDPQGCFVEANPALCRLLGYTRDDLLRLTLPEIVVPDELAAEPIDYDRLGTGATVVRERRLQRKDGSQISVEVSAKMLDDGCLQGIVRDVTQRRAEEQALRRSREELRHRAGEQDRLIESALERLQAEVNRREEMEREERRLREWLTAIHEVTNELSRSPTFDDLCRGAIELGRSRLGFDRLGLWFVGDVPTVVRGSFGVGEDGAIRDERGMTLRVRPKSEMGQLLARKARYHLEDRAPLRDHRGEEVATGHHAVAALWDGEQVIGCLTTDTMLTGRPITEHDCELLTLYASAIGHLCSRKRAEAELERERDLLHTLMDQIPDHLYFKDTKSRFTRANRALTDRLGLSSPEDIRGKTDHDFWPAELAEATRADEQRLVATGELVLDKLEENTDADGRRLWVSTTKVPLRDRDGTVTGVVGISRDVSARHEAEVQRAALTQGLRTVVAITDGLLAAPDRDMLLREAIRLARERLGMERCSIHLVDETDGELRGTYGTDMEGNTTDERCYTPESVLAGRLREQLTQALVEGGPRWFISHEVPQGVVEGGDLIPVGRGWVAATPIRSSRGLCGAFYNDAAISGSPPNSTTQEIASVFCSILGTLIEHKQDEEELRNSERRFRSLIEEGSDYIAVLDLEGVLRYASPSTERLMGYTPAELTGEHIFEHVHPEDRDAAFAAFVRATERPGATESAEFRFRTSDGGWRVLDAAATRRDGAPYGSVIVNARDITERKAAEDALQESNLRLAEALDELRRTQRQIIQRERLTALGQMAAAVAHDFNNTLTPILSLSDLLLKHPERLTDPGFATECLSIINSVGTEAATVVRRLIDACRPRDIGEVRLPLDLNRLVTQTVSFAQPRWRDEALAEGVSIRVNTEAGPIPEIVGNETELREAVTNLIFNAVDAIRGKVRDHPGDEDSEPHGTITLRTRTHDPEERAPAHVLLEITDDGVGMTDEVRQRCLDPFFTTKGERGVGMGLSVVHGIVTRHGGSIRVSSKPGEGATFTVRLPIHGGGRPEEAAESPDPEAASPARVLLVDDNASVRASVAWCLKVDGHHVDLAGDAREALERLETESYDLIITDVALPGMSGEELASEVTRTRPDQAIILMTGFRAALSDDPETFDDDTPVLPKPVTIADLRRAMTRVLQPARESD